MTIFFNFSPTSNHLHPLQVENCGSNSRLVVDEDDNFKFRLERVNWANACYTGRQYLRRYSNIEPVLAHLGAFWSPCDITRRETNIDADKLAAMTSKFAQRRFNTVLTSNMVSHN